MSGEVPVGPAPEPAPNPRAALVAELALHVARLVAAGDVEGARVAGEAMMRLLTTTPMDAPPSGPRR
jgi:hypothetical protein